MVKHILAAAFFLLGGIPSMAKVGNQPSMPYPNIKFQGQRFFVSNEQGQPLSDAMIFHVTRLAPIFSPHRTDEVARALGLPVSVETLRQEILTEADLHIEEFEFFQAISIGQHSLLAPIFTGVTEKGGFEKRVPKTPANPETNQGPNNPYCIGAFWLIFKPGYHPTVIFEDWSKAKEGEWIEHRVSLKLWPERAAMLANRPYVMGNLQLQKEINAHWNGRDPGSKPLFGKDPFTVWEERLQAFQKDALKRGNKVDAAWLELALALTTKRTPTGYSNDGGVDDYVNGRVWKVLDRMIELSPEMKIWQAYRDFRNFVLNSPMGLNQIGFPSERNKNFNGQALWTDNGLDMLLKLLDKYSDIPLVAIRLGNIANCNGFWKSEHKLRDRFFRHRVSLMATWVKKHPSALWFSSMDSLCSNLTAAGNFYYPLAFQADFKKIMKEGT